MHRVLAPVSILVAVIAAAACGDSAPEDEAATAADTKAYCDSACAENLRCATAERAADPECLDDCLEHAAWFTGNVRLDLVRGLTSCYSTLACDENEDVCTTRAAEAAGLDPKKAMETPEAKACIAKQNECQDTPYSFVDGVCADFVFVVSSKQARLAACYEKPCPEVIPCRESIVPAR